MYPLIKRCFDVVGAAALLVLLFPLMVGVALYIATVTRSMRVLFLQRRAGRHGIPFQVIKFKTMTDARDTSGGLLPDGQRLKRWGVLLRSTSLDELPQLLNVFSGSMSFVGPRPLHVSYLPLYSAEQAARHNVKPGITGWAQVNGRNTLSWEQKFRLDVWYTQNMSLMLDVKILWLTVQKVLLTEGINSANAATMERFTGSK